MAIKERVKTSQYLALFGMSTNCDQIINDRGIGIDVDFVKAALKIDGESKAKIQAELKH